MGYYDSKALGSTAVRIAATQSVAHYLATKDRESDAMTKGTAVHAAILEPEAVGSRIIVAPRCQCVAKTKSGKQCSKGSVPGSDHCGIHGGNEEAEAWRAGLADNAVVVPEDVMSEAQETSEAVRKQLERFGLGGLMSHWRTEVPMFATARLIDEAPGYVIEPEGGPIDVRCKVDFIAGEPIVLAGDLKGSARGVEPWSFARTVRASGYHVQASLYTDIITAVTGAAPKTWMWIVHESVKPWGVRIYEAIPEDLGRKAVAEGLRRWSEYFESGDQWAGWPCEIEKVCLPRYREDEED